MKPTVFIAIGSNLGFPRENVLRAFRRLRSLSAEPLLESSLWETTPVDCSPGSPRFVNAVVALHPHPGATSEFLLTDLKAIEREFGRRPKTVVNEPRPLDLDLLAFGAQTRSTPDLTLPHPRAHQRRFVLQPLSEIAPELVLPGQQMTVAELLAKVPADPTMKRVTPRRAFARKFFNSVHVALGLVTLCGGALAVAQPALNLGDSGQAPGLATNTLSAEEILRRAVEVRGGRAAAARIRSFRCKGTADFATGFRADYEYVAARPNQTRLTFRAGGNGQYDFAFDGETAWENRPDSAPEILTGQKLLEYRDGAAFFAWLYAPRSYHSATLVGETTFEGRKCYELKLLTRSNLEQTHYYDASNCLLYAVVESTTLDSGPGWLTTVFQDYRDYSGFLFPTRLRGRTEAGEWVFRVKSVDLNCVVADAFRRPAAPKAAEPPASLSEPELNTMVRDFIEGDKLGVGLVVGLVDAEGTRVASCGRFDTANSADVNADTLFEIGSITKVFTRMLLEDMVARGEMNMDDPVQKYLPASVQTPVLHGRQITLWDLATHTSGFRRDLGDPYTVEHLYAFLRFHKPRREPGEQFEYSNLGVALLGHVISLKAGQDYETLVRDRICRPLHMDSTVISLTPELQARRAAGHALFNRPAGYIGLQALPGSGALFSTANDMLKLASAAVGLSPFPLNPAMKRAIGGHNGGTFGFSTMLALDLKRHRGLVVLSNCRSDIVCDHFVPLLKNRSPRPPAAVQMTADSISQYVGQYYAGADRFWTVRRDGERLFLRELADPGCEIFPLSETNFYNQLFSCRASFTVTAGTNRSPELVVGDPAHPSWRGLKVPGQVLAPLPNGLPEADCPPRAGSDLQGVWNATLRPWYWPFLTVHVRVRVVEPTPGEFRAELDSSDLGVKSLPLAVLYNRPTLSALGFAGEGSFQGKVNAAHNKVTGHWKVDGRSLMTTFQRVERAPAPQAAR